MGRQVSKTYCLRSTLPPSPEMDETELEPNKDSPDALTGPENEAMTWQQKTDFPQPKPKRNPGRANWKPFDPEAEADQTTAAEAANSWAAQKAEFGTTIEQPCQKARGKVATPTSTHSTAVAPARPLLPQTPDSNAHKTSKQTRKGHLRNKNKTQDHSMATPPKGKEYVPPHLRKNKSANGKEYVPPHLRKNTSSNGKEYVPPHLRSNHASVSVKEHLPPHLRSHNSASGSLARSPKSKLSTTTKLHSSPICANQHQDAPPSPPTTPQEPQKPEQHREVVTDPWALANLIPASAAKKSFGNPRWPRGLQPYKKTEWPKARDMKYIPHSSDEEYERKSNSNGDPDYDVKKLLDWNGDWLPPPESWCARKGYEDRHFGQRIEQWMDNQSPACVKPVFFPQYKFNGHAKRITKIGIKDRTEYVPEEGRVCKELAPRYWLDEKVGGKTLSAAWKDLGELKLKPVDESDMEDLPWWERYEDVIYTQDGQKNLSPFINSLAAPDDKVDPDHPDNQVEGWHLASTEEKVQAKKRRAEEKHRKMLARRNRPIPDTPGPPVVDRRLRPTINMYVRPVQPGDVKGITEIYNWYVENSIYAFEFDARTEAQMGQRITDIINAGLPYLVAIDRGNRSRLTNDYVSERIVGFIQLEDYCGQSTLFRYTFEMELYVHPGFLNKGIGKCLMDRILEMTDTSYNVRGGYEYINNFDYLKQGPSRVVKTILLNVHHENGGESVETGWQSKFLSAFKFNRSGRLPKVGYKKDKVVDVSIFAHHTREDIVASGRPTVAG